MNLLFDLDGTLTDSRPGIARCIQHALERHGGTAPSADALTPFIGPPLARTFATLLNTSDRDLIDSAVASYRERFEQVGLYESKLYPGIADMLETFANRGHDLFIVTAKARVYAERVAAHCGLEHLFRAVIGPELSERDCTKASLIGRCCETHAVPPAAALMVGDRHEDIAGGRDHGMLTAAVTWGYGPRQELEACGADYLVESVPGLVDCVTECADRRAPGVKSAPDETA